MALIASEVMTRARAVLNDVAGDLYTNSVQLPYLQIASTDLSDELVDVGATVQKEVTAEITVLAGAKTLTLPDDIIVPIALWEKFPGEEDSSYVPIIQTTLLSPDIIQGSSLGVYEWRSQDINFPGATTDKIVKLRYYSIPTAIVGDSTPIELVHAWNYLAYHTAALCAEHIGQNLEKALALESVASVKLAKLTKREIKQNQSQATRRRGFGYNRRVRRII